MSTKNNIGPSSGRIVTSQITLNLLAHKTIEFVHNHLKAWRDDPNRPKEQVENILNSQLCDFLDVRARTEYPMIHFKTEKLQAEQRRADVAVSPTETLIIEADKYTIYDPVLVLEGKRLPAPSSDRQKEYITGYEKKSGGIQRFKLGLHGGKLPIAAMVGYIQDGTVPAWYGNINSWLKELAGTTTSDGCKWKKNEKLVLFKQQPGTMSSDIAHYQSAHGRNGNGVTSKTIELHHLWVTMNKIHNTK